jgi:DNA-binding response OmpR family regulator
VDDSWHALVIEDEIDVLELMTAHLGRMGYAVTGAQTGEAGLALALARPPDLIMLDFLLPGIDGREVVRQLRGDPRTERCAVVLWSVLDPVDMADVPADAVLTKPFSRAAMERVISALPHRRSAQPTGSPRGEFS